MSTYHDDEFDVLKGKKIFGVEKSEQYLRFNLNGDAVSFKAVGDCCSESFIEDMDNPEIFNDATFISVESVEGAQDFYSAEKSCTINWTFYKFTTDKGMCTLSFRNESNGYYDGHLELVR